VRGNAGLHAGLAGTAAPRTPHTLGGVAPAPEGHHVPPSNNHQPKLTPLAEPRPPRVVLSYGLGVDSTAILLRWILEPTSRNFALDELLVITAMTGDEWAATGDLVTAHILPLMAAHQVRYAQVARAGPSQTDGITVLDDSSTPTRLHLSGAYTLSDELLAAGTIPQLAGNRLCSAKSKGFPLDLFIAGATAGRPFAHVIGFEANEPKRAAKDAKYNTAARTGTYPLIEWGWDRDRASAYIKEATGVDWPKSACTYCPFSLSAKAAREAAINRFNTNMTDGVGALFLEHVALSLNPAQGLVAGGLAALVAPPVRDALQNRLDGQPHALYEVRRVLRARDGDPYRLANASRSVHARATGTRAQMAAALAGEAARRGLPLVTDEHGLARVWVVARPVVFPGVEHLLVAAPAVVADKAMPAFESWWDQARTDGDQSDLLAA